jgi:hypothetical protein
MAEDDAICITPTVGGYIFNGLGLALAGITERNLACLERSVERALAGKPEKQKQAKEAIDQYRKTH